MVAFPRGAPLSRVARASSKAGSQQAVGMGWPTGGGAGAEATSNWVGRQWVVCGGVVQDEKKAM